MMIDVWGVCAVVRSIWGKSRLHCQQPKGVMSCSCSIPSTLKMIADKRLTPILYNAGMRDELNVCDCPRLQLCAFTQLCSTTDPWHCYSQRCSCNDFAHIVLRHQFVK